MPAAADEARPELLCTICGTGRAPFLRYGTLERTGRMCADCLRRTRICSRCQCPAEKPVPVAFVHGGSGPGRTEYACRGCADRGGPSSVRVIDGEVRPGSTPAGDTGLRLERGAT
ncbi:hypothetical protein F9278_22780 [Streptomyces phaeolivaceus]|uniref:Uncharacterized protein n=1 Tax=Streptomyces phaeolivaceus TaxID=2653200 RepID=A0A5P8K601_9ACTN|nr:hypothetical protein F9278_22780 [Streptomyces phaeolivaceus]